MREDASVIKKAKDQACAECGPTNLKCKPFGGSLPTTQALTAAPGAEGSSSSKSMTAAPGAEGKALTTVDAFGVDNVFGQSVAQGERCWGCPAECPIPFDEKPTGTAYTCCTLQYKRYVNEINYEMVPPLLEFYTRGTPFYDSTLPLSGCVFPPPIQVIIIE